MTSDGRSALSKRSKNTLACLHYVMYDDVPPVKGDLVWCALCQNYRRVTEVEVIGSEIPAWRWKCSVKHKNRELVKTFVGRKLECEKSAIAHAKRNRHTVIMYRPSGDVYHTYAGHDPQQLSLPVTSDDQSDEMPF